MRGGSLLLFFCSCFIFSLPLRSDRGRFSRLLFFSSLSLLLFVFFLCSDGMEREACVCDHGYERSDLCGEIIIIIIISRWTSSLPSCLWSQRIFPSLPGSRLTIFYRDKSSALLQLVSQWLNFTYYSRSHAFRYERKNTNPTLVRIELTTSALAGVQVTY